MTTEIQMLGSYAFAIGIVVSLLFLFALYLEMIFPVNNSPKTALGGFAVSISLVTLGFGVTFRIVEYFI